MPTDVQSVTSNLPSSVSKVLQDFVNTSQSAFGPDLRSIVLYGSAAEGKLRASSDVNLILVLSGFDQSKAKQLQVSMRTAQAAIRLTAMFLLESEIPSVASAFAVKFSDIVRRHRVLHGTDPFSSLPIPRSASIARLKQVLLNLRLRLRASYVLRGRREEQLALLVADVAGPLRASAATILEFEDRPAASPKEALEHIALSLPEPDWKDVLEKISQARENRILPAGTAEQVLFRLITLTQHMQTRLEKL